MTASCNGFFLQNRGDLYPTTAKTKRHAREKTFSISHNPFSTETIFPFSHGIVARKVLLAGGCGSNSFGLKYKYFAPKTIYTSAQNYCSDNLKVSILQKPRNKQKTTIKGLYPREIQAFCQHNATA